MTAAMNRRELLRLGAATIGVTVLAKTAIAQNAPAVTAPPAKLKLDAYSRTLHWLRTPKEVAEACHEIGNTTIDLTVRTYPGHVQPEKVKTDLPPFVKALQSEGITVTCMAAEITDAKTPYVEDMLGTASSLGIRHHWWRGFAYTDDAPYQQQIDGFKLRSEKLAKLEEKYGTKAMYHPGGGFSAVYFDLLDMLRNFDPRFLSVQYDTGNLFQANQGNMAMQLRLGALYIGGFVFKDVEVDHGAPDAPVVPPEASQAATASRGGAAAGSADAAAQGGRGAGRGPSTAVNGFRTQQVPVGTGMINLALIAQTLKETNFNGPMECQPEWPALDGAGQGLDKLSIPREEVIGKLKRDYTTVASALATSGLM
jgi:sugar phosphate isomerase/epimerase